jgi:hypothetical protein
VHAVAFAWAATSSARVELCRAPELTDVSPAVIAMPFPPTVVSLSGRNLPLGRHAPSLVCVLEGGAHSTTAAVVVPQDRGEFILCSGVTYNDSVATPGSSLRVRLRVRGDTELFISNSVELRTVPGGTNLPATPSVTAMLAPGSVSLTVSVPLPLQATVALPLTCRVRVLEGVLESCAGGVLVGEIVGRRARLTDVTDDVISHVGCDVDGGMFPSMSAYTVCISLHDPATDVQVAASTPAYVAAPPTLSGVLHPARSAPAGVPISVELALSAPSSVHWPGDDSLTCFATDATNTSIRTPLRWSGNGVSVRCGPLELSSDVCFWLGPPSATHATPTSQSACVSVVRDWSVQRVAPAVMAQTMAAPPPRAVRERGAGNRRPRPTRRQCRRGPASSGSDRRPVRPAPG